MTSLLKNFFMPFSDPYSGAERAAFRRFELGSGSLTGPPATFSTGWDALGRWVNNVEYVCGLSLFEDVLDLVERIRGKAIHCFFPALLVKITHLEDV